MTKKELAFLEKKIAQYDEDHEFWKGFYERTGKEDAKRWSEEARIVARELTCILGEMNLI